MTVNTEERKHAFTDAYKREFNLDIEASKRFLPNMVLFRFLRSSDTRNSYSSYVELFRISGVSDDWQKEVKHAWF